MDELLANLNTDTPMFDAPSVLGPTFDMENGFITDQPDQVGLYGSDMGALRPTNSLPTPTPPINTTEIDYLAVDEPDIAKQALASSTPLPSPPTPSVVTEATACAAVASKAPGNVSASAPMYADLQELSVPTAKAEPLPQQSDVAHPTAESVPMPDVDMPTDSERAQLRPLALNVVSDSWRASRNPADFVSSVRKRLPNSSGGSGGGGVVEDSSNQPAVSLTSGVKQEAKEGKDSDVSWQLPLSSEGAVLDALFIHLVKGEATSTRLLSYLSYSLLTGIVSQRSVISTCLKWVNATPNISERVMRSLARFMATVLPHYIFAFAEDDLTPEVKEFLGMFTMILKYTARSPSLASDLVRVLNHDRIVALVRACARRIPSVWPQLDAAIAELENPTQTSVENQNSFAPQSAFSVAPELKELVPRLKRGLCVGITSLESIASSIGNLGVPPSDASLPVAIQTAFAVTLQVFGNEVAAALRDLWSQREGQGGDLPLLGALERATKATTNPNQSHSSTPKYSFKNKVQACEAIVRFLAERSSVPGASEKWKGLWGGKERLKRIIRDAIPQVKNDIRSEAGALIVSMSVTCCAAMCLGPSLRIDDPNDGVDVLDAAEASQQESQNEEVEETMGELISFAVGSLEEAATAEETPLWRSFGLWLLLLMSRSGSMLRASGCEHARAARVLRAWAGMPTGTPGSHTAHGSSSHKHSSQSGSTHQQSQASNYPWSMTEGVSMFAASSSLAIIDVSDVSGSNDTIKALCDDLVQ